MTIWCNALVNRPRPSSSHICSHSTAHPLSLPQNQIIQLKECILAVEKVQTAVQGVRDAKQVHHHCVVAAVQFLREASVENLGTLIGNVREGFFLVTKKMPFRIQCMCVAAFFLPMLAVNAGTSADSKGRLGQVATGEGRIVAMTALLYGLLGRNVDVITSTQALARRDADEFHTLFKFFGISVSTVAIDDPSHHDFNARVLYGTNTDFEFAQLREGSECRQIRMIDPRRSSSWVPRVPDVAIVDESDNLFLDAACNSARIGHTTGSSFTWVYSPLFHLVRQRVVGPDGELLPKELAGILCPSAGDARTALALLEDGAYGDQLARFSDSQLTRWLHAAVVALHSKRRDTHYIVKQRKIVIVDLDTGRLQENSRWGSGIHEMVEVKEAVPVIAEQGTIASISHPSFFDFYKTLVGITGTAGEPEEREEIRAVYGIDTFDVPPHRPCLRKRLPTLVFRSLEDKFAEMERIVKGMCKTRSVLVLVPDIKASKAFSKRLTAAGVRHLLLNEEQQESEDLVIHKAGQIGSVTVATNTAGRGTDIKISKALQDAGGLHLLFGYFPTNLRVECQGLGRSARQGQPGSNQIVISLDEALVQGLMVKAGITPPAVFVTNGAVGNDGEGQALVEKLYSARTADILTISTSRCRTTSLERVRFATLQLFFMDQKLLAGDLLTAHSAPCQQAYAELIKTIPLPPLQQLCTRLLEWFRWTIYFTKIANSDSTLLTEQEAQQLYRSGIENERLINSKAAALYDRFLQEARWPLTSIGASLVGSIVERVSAVFREHGQLATHMHLEKSQVLDELRG